MPESSIRNKNAKLLNSSDTIINPATEDKQDVIIAALGTISPSTNMEGGGKLSVGTTAVEVTITGTPKVILLTADSANTGELYVGKSNVTSLGANAITFLLPGESVELQYDDTTNAVYIVASVAAQNFYKGALI